ncbi:hypothetical protein GDO81_011660 [Engystomops pustulosus]|uniref:Ribosome-binding factor A, mitochondrial n=1 Tax=Engystomops pustulosus TaxID=76066 RepID=A0AAV7BG27_ENGPU|nr:hypothetical protein GDO81_011660 [Engystomops pustulosus]
MRTSGAVVSGLLRVSSCPSTVLLLRPSPGRGCTHQHTRCVHLSPVLTAKNMLHKFNPKSKKKPWYDTAIFMRPDKPHGLMSLMKAQQKEKRGNNARIKILNSILHKALNGLLSTSEVNEEVFDLQIELSKVSVTVDFSVCRAYWVTSGNKETDANIETVLQKYAPSFRHLLITHQILGNVPTIVFLKDQEEARRQEIEDLLATLDFGDNNDSTIKSDDNSELECSSVAELSTTSTPSLFGIDHTLFNQKIVDYKKKMKENQIENSDTEFSVQQKEQLAEIKKQKLLKKKSKKQRWSEHDSMAPQDYLLAMENSLYSDKQEGHAKEDMEEKEDGGNAKHLT